MADDPEVQRWWAKLLRTGTSPAGAEALIRLYADIDARHVLPTITAPDARAAPDGRSHDPRGAGRAIAAAIPGARFVELPGDAHLPVSDPDQIIDEVEEFLTGAAGRTATRPHAGHGPLHRHRRLDCPRGRARRPDLAAAHRPPRRPDASRDRAPPRPAGETLGDGFLATFDGPARAIRCAAAARDAVRALGLEIRAGLHTG
jgi:hypothetical protein